MSNAAGCCRTTCSSCPARRSRSTILSPNSFSARFGKQGTGRSRAEPGDPDRAVERLGGGLGLRDVRRHDPDRDDCAPGSRPGRSGRASQTMPQAHVAAWAPDRDADERLASRADRLGAESCHDRKTLFGSRRRLRRRQDDSASRRAGGRRQGSGVDYSPASVATARRTNAAGIASGRVDIRHASSPRFRSTATCSISRRRSRRTTTGRTWYPISQKSVVCFAPAESSSSSPRCIVDMAWIGSTRR